MTEEEKNQAAAYIKLQDDVKELVKETLMEILKGYDYALIERLQNVTLGHPAFDTRVKQVITNQMQR